MGKEIILNFTSSSTDSIITTLSYYRLQPSFTTNTSINSIYNEKNMTESYHNVTTFQTSTLNTPLDCILTQSCNVSVKLTNTSQYNANHNLSISKVIKDHQIFTNSSQWPSDLESEPELKVYYPVLAVFLAFICIIVIFGNVLIMVSIRRERYLQTLTNFFVASLAFADCLVGAIVMPSSVVYEVMNKKWIFGRDWCDIWHSFDVLASTASILNLCVISVDRYWAITNPITYPSKMTPKRAQILITLVWSCSSLISFPAIIWWRAASVHPPRPFQCDFTEDTFYLVFSSTISFYGPLTVMLFVYFRIYRAAVHQTKSIKLGCKQIQSSDGGECILRIHRGGGSGGSSGSGSGSGSGNRSSNNEVSNMYMSKYPNNIALVETHDFLVNSQSNGLEDKITPSRGRSIRPISISRKFTKFAKEKKAAKTLGIVVGVFVLCWLPFFITNIIKGLCNISCPIDPDSIYPLVTWLGWLNSGMNPVIYACWSKDFRRAFKKLLCPCYQDNLVRRRTQKSRCSYYFVS